MDIARTLELCERTWDESIVPTLEQYIGIPNQSPAFDAEWSAHGFMDQAVALVAGWMQAQEVRGLKLEVVRLPGRTPVIFAEVPGEGDDTVLLYGHVDKQPPMEGWLDGLGPWTPVRRGTRLYGRGSADDGYAAFAATTALRALGAQKIPHARCVVLIEACEESGSPDLPAYIEHLAARIGTPSLVVCLDSGCGDYERLWMTTSLRGLLTGTLQVGVLNEGVHSGDASGIVPSSFRILRHVLGRLEDDATGNVLPKGLHVEVPEERLRQAGETARVLGEAVHAKYPWLGKTRPVSTDGRELLLNRTWRPQLEITGVAGLPPLGNAGNVLRPRTAVKVSLRLPPTARADASLALVKALFEADPPHGAEVTFTGEQAAAGWNAPPTEAWLTESVRRASLDAYGQEPCAMGEGGTIPFMAMLGEKFPRAQFLITGVLGPGSNAHGPNEFLEVAYAKRLTAAVARVLADHHARP
jgi:acetylornithine deacetylase/succinyl-diaminopimelate desuccinylase-like protein